MELHDIVEGLKKPGKSKLGLAKALGRQPSAVTSLLKGARRIQASEVPIIQDYLEIGDNQQRTVPLAGYVGAGAETHYYAESQGNIDRVLAPEGSTESTIAVEIRGDSLGSFFDRWLVFYDDLRSPVTPDLIGYLCVVGLRDNRVLIKKIKRSRIRGLYHLLSQIEEPILDAEVEWAAKVKNMVPR